MNALRLHLLVNHLPVLGVLLGAVLVVAALPLRRLALWRSGTLALALAGALAYPVQLTGERAEEVAESRWYTAREAIHAHEEAGERATWLAVLAGALAAYAWVRARRGPTADGQLAPAWLQGAVPLAAIAATAAIWYAAYRGGEITHDNPWLARPTMPPVDSVPVKLPPGALAPAR